MLRMRQGLIVALLSVALQGGGFAGCGAKPGANMANSNVGNVNGAPINVNATTQPSPERSEEPLNDELKELAVGAYGKIQEPFVAVARDAETYAALRAMVESLPPFDAEFFKTHLVVAAFLGQRRTGGYSVQIKRADINRLRVSSNAPPPGSMTTQALTAPFKIVSVGVNDDRPLAIELEPSWKNEMRPYRLTNGEFKTGGGFGGRFETIQLAGELRVSRLGKLATFVFDLKSTSGAKARSLQDAATGVVADGGNISGAVVDAGSLVDSPHSALGVKGSFAANEDKLSLSFESLPSNVSDGYVGQGKLEAAATAPAPPKKKTSSDDDPI
jgi:PrcB C-terminal